MVPKQIAFPAEDLEVDMHFKAAYDWLVPQMEALTGKRPQGVAYPIWTWAKLQGRGDGKPDMRSFGRNWERPCVRLQLEIDDSRIVLTDEERWHFVLSGWHLPKDDADGRAFDEAMAAAGFPFGGLYGQRFDDLAKPLRKRCESSWQQIFDVEGDAGPDWPWIKRSAQATFWELKQEDVVNGFAYFGIDKLLGARRKA